MPEYERAKYKTQAASSDHRAHGIKSEPTTESKFHDTPVVEPPMSAAELEEEQKHKNFQLHTLLKDAGTYFRSLNFLF